MHNIMIHFFRPKAISVVTIFCLFSSVVFGRDPEPNPENKYAQKLTGFETPKNIAFPGAMGGGQYTTGGRGGKVIKVTNLNDSGEGSFRAALAAKYPRTIIFDISGTIELLSPISVKSGNLTIAGQTAPGDGICIKGHEFRISADNIIIRYMRFRPGDIAGKQYDALTGIGQKNIIIDHCSMSWSTDETVSFYDNENFTLQWSIVSESLNNSVHSKGAHGYGGIWGGKNASFIYNLLAHHNSRNPRLQGARSYQESDMEKAEIMYNIVYNWGDKAMYGGENGRYNITNNQFIPGPGTSKDNRMELLEPYKPFGKFFLNGNFLSDMPEMYCNNWLGVTASYDEIPALRADVLFTFDEITGYNDPGDVYYSVLSHAGASLARDTVDKRIIKELSERTYTFGNKGIIDSQEETGGWPVLQSCPAPVDTDGDGMPDAWETMNGLDPSAPADGLTYSINSQYTNLEVYLNSLLISKISDR